MTTIDPVVAEVTDRIIRRSSATRTAYLERVDSASSGEGSTAALWRITAC